jgi:hypothetical protein
MSLSLLAKDTVSYCLKILASLKDFIAFFDNRVQRPLKQASV